MELIGYDITLEPTGLHKITLDCIGNEKELDIIRKVYNTGVYQAFGLSRSCEREHYCAMEQMKAYILGTNNEKENKNMTATELCRIEREAYDKGYKRGREVGRTEGFVDGRRASSEIIDRFYIGKTRIKKVIFNDPATIVFWADGTKTVAKAHGDDKFDKEVGLTVCIAKKALGNRRHFDAVFKKWIK